MTAPVNQTLVCISSLILQVRSPITIPLQINVQTTSNEIWVFHKARFWERKGSLRALAYFNLIVINCVRNPSFFLSKHEVSDEQYKTVEKEKVRGIFLIQEEGKCLLYCAFKNDVIKLILSQITCSKDITKIMSPVF